MTGTPEFSSEDWLASRAQKKPLSNWSKRTDAQRKLYNERKRAKRRREKLNGTYKKQNVSESSQAFSKDKYLKKTYGVSSDWYDEQFKAQGGVCYICCRPSGSKSLMVDHCHNTGSVRKLLCFQCNTSLGLVKENIGVLYSMIDYVVEHSIKEAEQSGSAL